MVSVQVNYLAVLIAGIGIWVTGAVWYGVLFGERWIAAIEKTREQAGKSLKPMVTSFIANLVMAFALACVIATASGGSPTLATGIESGFLVALGFVVTAEVVANGFENRPLALTFINGGYWLLSFIVGGAIIGFFG